MKVTKSMKNNVAFLAACLCLLSSAQAQVTPERSGDGGTKGGNGGDMSCADRIELIRNNLQEWIQAGKASGLDFKETNTTLEKYNSEMSRIINLTRERQDLISCTTNPNEVANWVGGSWTPICAAGWLDRKRTQPKILCYSGEERHGEYAGGLMGMSGKQQYGQIHHEFAVLAGFEDQTREYWNYPLSSRISESTTETTYWLLPVVQAANASDPLQDPEMSDRLNMLVRGTKVILKQPILLPADDKPFFFMSIHTPIGGGPSWDIQHCRFKFEPSEEPRKIPKILTVSKNTLRTTQGGVTSYENYFLQFSETGDQLEMICTSFLKLSDFAKRVESIQVPSDIPDLGAR